MKKYISLLLTIGLMASVLTGCAVQPAPTSPETAVPTVVPTEEPSQAPEIQEQLPNLMVMSGPTGVGAAKLMADADTGKASVIASASVVADNEAVKNALINGDADIAAIATNMAATLCNKTDGALQVLAVNTLGVLYILEKGNSIETMSDLTGKTLYATGQGANPEYVLNYLLNESGVEPTQIDIQWLTAQEITAKMATEESGICMLPVPAATALMMKDESVHQVISLSEVWDSLDNGALAQGCIVARTEYIQNNPKSIASFLTAYEDSINYMTQETNREDAAGLVAQYEITANAQIAAKAIPYCNLVCVRGQEMKDMLVKFYDVLFRANPASIGGKMPHDTFYYGVE